MYEREDSRESVKRIKFPAVENKSSVPRTEQALLAVDRYRLVCFSLERLAVWCVGPNFMGTYSVIVSSIAARWLDLRSSIQSIFEM